MADLEFNGINIDAETVRAKLAKYDATVKVLGRSLETSNAAELYVVDKYGADEVRLDFEKNGTGAWTWDADSLDELAEFVTQLAVDIREHGVQ